MLMAKPALKWSLSPGSRQAQAVSARIWRISALHLEIGVPAPRCPTRSPVARSSACRRPIRSHIPRLAVTGVGRHRRPSRSCATRAPPVGRHGYRRPQRIARLRSQALSGLLHEALIAKSTGRQRIPAYCARGVEAAGQRARPLLGSPRAPTGNRSRGDRAGHVREGPTDHPSWSRSQAVYSGCTCRFPTTVVPRIARVVMRRLDTQTGRVRYRRVRRRRPLCGQGGLAGGYVLVNDGPAFAAQLAAAISAG